MPHLQCATISLVPTIFGGRADFSVDNPALPAILAPNASTFTVIGPSTIFFVGAPGLLCEIPNVHTLERRRGDHNLHRAIPRACLSLR